MLTYNGHIFPGLASDSYVFFEGEVWPGINSLGRHEVGMLEVVSLVDTHRTLGTFHVNITENTNVSTDDESLAGRLNEVIHGFEVNDINSAVPEYLRWVNDYLSAISQELSHKVFYGNAYDLLDLKSDILCSVSYIAENGEFVDITDDFIVIKSAFSIVYDTVHAIDSLYRYAKFSGYVYDSSVLSDTYSVLSDFFLKLSDAVGVESDIVAITHAISSIASEIGIDNHIFSSVSSVFIDNLSAVDNIRTLAQFISKVFDYIPINTNQSVFRLSLMSNDVIGIKSTIYANANFVSWLLDGLSVNSYIDTIEISIKGTITVKFSGNMPNIVFDGTTPEIMFKGKIPTIIFKGE